MLAKIQQMTQELLLIDLVQRFQLFHFSKKALFNFSI